jgi:uncharacterized membrane-anchored protein YhcB (DUF1043 family)
MFFIIYNPRKAMNQLKTRFVYIITFMVLAVLNGNSQTQTTMPDELKKNKLKEQLNYLEEHTRIYENYRAIREDMFQKIKVNITDSLSEAKAKITGFVNLSTNLNHTIDSLKNELETSNTNLEEMTRTKNSIRVLGFEVNKLGYNKAMWTIVIGLLTTLAIGFLLFKRNRLVTVRTKNELKELKDEFEAYRKTSREAREKMSMDHFNELKRLKGG